MCASKRSWSDATSSDDGTDDSTLVVVPTKAPRKKGPPPAPRGPQVRRWCFTIFTKDTVADPESLRGRDPTYMVWQREKSPETGTLHLQGYVVLPRKATMAGVKKWLDDATCHLEPARGTDAQAADYCKKAESRDVSPNSGPFEEGDMPAGKAGTRNDLLAVKKAIDGGSTSKEVADTHFGTWIRYYRGFSAYRQLSAIPRSRQTECAVYWGPAGSGKTRAASEFDSPEHTFWLPRPSGSTVWWDNYTGQRTVVIDEFYGWIRRDTCQRLVDRTPLRVEVKGGSINFTARTVIFTSNSPPEDWWPRVGLGAMSRRLVAPIGFVHYVGNEEYPDPELYKMHLRLERERRNAVSGHGPVERIGS